MKTIKGVLTGASIATIVAASIAAGVAIKNCVTEEELPQATPIGYKIDSKHLEGHVDVKGLASYIRSIDGEVGNNLADTLNSGKYATLDLMPMPRGGDYSAQILALNADGTGRAVFLTEEEAGKVLGYFKDFKDAPNSGRDRYVPPAVVRQIIENNTDFPDRLEGMLEKGEVISNSCGSDSVAQVIRDDNGYVILRGPDVSVINGACSITSRVTPQDRDHIDDSIVSNFY